MRHVLVTGASGVLGRHVVPRLLDGGCAVRTLSRSGDGGGAGVEAMRGDLSSGEGVRAAVEGMDIIVHCAGSAKGDDVKTLHLIQAATAAGKPHLVYISVVGAERIPIVSGLDRAMYGYFGFKLAAERIVAESGLPWTTLRATQFHDLIFTTAQAMTKLPITPTLSGARFQPVESAEVATRLVELALGVPMGLAPDFGGPRVYTMEELLRGYLRATHQRRPLVSLWQPGQAARAVRAGANLTPDHADGVRTWEEFLAERVGPASSAGSRVA